MNKHKFTTQITIYVMASIVIVALNSFLSLFLFKVQTEKLFSDITENQELAVVYKKAGEMKNILENYLETGNQDHVTYFAKARTALQETIGKELKEYAAGAQETDKVIQRRNLAGLFETFMGQADRIFEAKEQGDVTAYVSGYESLLDVYKEIDLYIKEITSEQLMEKADQYGQVQKQMGKSYSVSIGMTVLVALIVLILVTLYSVEMTKPILRLETYAKKLEGRDFDFEIPEENSSEELSTLYRSFGDMKDSIRDYIDMSQKKQELEEQLNRQNIENLEMRNLLKEAELQALQAQIDPHFLFNTINIGAQMATLHDDDETADYFYHVADLFRYNIKGVDQDTTLNEELQYVLNYVRLMQTRFGKKYQFQYENRVEEALMELHVPKMILQPLVENAYTHGLRKQEHRGLLELFLERDENFVYVHVRNSGPDMAQQKIQEILHNTGSDPGRHENQGNGIGLENVITRLRLWSKQEEVMKIFSGSGKTEFIVILPFQAPEKKGA